MDENFEVPERDVDKDFLMSIDQSINIPGRGTVVTGTIEQGEVKNGDEVHMIGIKRKPTPTIITGIETFHKQLDSGVAGDNVGVLLRGILRDEVKRGMCIAKPGSIEIRRNFEGELYILKSEEGGRHKPFFSGYRPQCFIRTADSAVDITLDEEVEMAMPGDNLTAKMKLNFPVPLVQGQRFALREGGRTVAAGVITKLFEDTAEDIAEEEERAAKKK